MKIVVVDGYALNPGDLSWAELEEFGSMDVYENTTFDELFDRVKDAGIILSNKVAIADKLLDRLPKLKYVGVTATGVNVIDVERAKEKGIVVTNVPGYGTHSVAQHVFALILAFANSVSQSSVEVHKGKWSEAGQWCYWDKPLTELAGKCFGIIGLGAIGRQVAAIGTAFGMKVIYHNPHPKQLDYQHVSINEIFSQADYLSLNCPLNSATEHIVNVKNLSLMKPESIVINTSRGPLINEHDLLAALQNGTIAGAGLDVLSIEPPQDNVLIGAPNCIITPHQAWATGAARQRLLNVVVDNLKCFLKGESKNVVG